MEVLIEITKANDVSKLNMRGMFQESERVIINGFFSIVGATVPFTERKTSVDKEKLEQRTVQIDTNNNNEPPKFERPRRLPLLGSENRMTTKIGEMAKIIVESEQKEHWITGIKTDEDGTKRYRCYYWCSCGGKGKRYIPFGTETINCRECEKELQVRAATSETDENGLPVRDDFGNFFVATAAIENIIKPS